MDELNSKLTVLIPYDLKMRFKVACTLNHTEMSEVVRDFIESWLEEHKTRQK